MKSKLDGFYVPLDPSKNSDHIDWSKAIRGPIMPKLKLTREKEKEALAKKKTKSHSESVTIEIPAKIASQLKTVASQRDISFQTLIKRLLTKALKAGT